MHHISKNWECVFDFQYKVTIGQCVSACLVSDNCNVLELVANGYCNDETNNAGCNFDGGDCCLSNVNRDHCSDCTCYLQETCVAGFPPPSIGDGFCNDEFNTVHCYYDGLDCCRSPVNTELCSNCTCHGELKTFYSYLSPACVVRILEVNQ